jgi:hypothetical protein
MWGVGRRGTVYTAKQMVTSIFLMNHGLEVDDDVLRDEIYLVRLLYDAKHNSVLSISCSSKVTPRRLISIQSTVSRHISRYVDFTVPHHSAQIPTVLYDHVVGVSLLAIIKC